MHSTSLSICTSSKWLILHIPSEFELLLAPKVGSQIVEEVEDELARNGRAAGGKG
jgi:hypothetical protein